MSGDRFASQVARGALEWVRRAVRLAFPLSLVLALSACLFETAKPVFQPGDVVVPAGLAEVYRLTIPHAESEAREPLYLRFRPGPNSAYEATLFGLEGEAGAKTWKAETYIMRFVALEGHWYAWELASREVVGGTARWYGFVELGEGRCRWVDSFPNTDEPEIDRIAEALGLDLHVSMGPPRLEGQLTTEKLKAFFQAVLAGPGAKAPMGACEPSELPADLKASIGNS